MTSKEFVLWLQGFTEGVHEYNISPKQWDTLKAKLFEVSDEQPIGVPIGGGGMGVPNTQPFPRWQEPHFATPSIDGFAVAATPGYGSITYTPSTSTAYGYPRGSAWNYTDTRYKPPYTTGEGLDDMKVQHNED